MNDRHSFCFYTIHLTQVVCPSTAVPWVSVSPLRACISLYTHLIFLRMRKSSVPDSSKHQRSVWSLMEASLEEMSHKILILPHPREPRNHPPSVIDGSAMTRGTVQLEGRIDIPLPLSSRSLEASPQLWSPSLSLGNWGRAQVSVCCNRKSW